LVNHTIFFRKKVRTWREKKHWASEAGEEHKPLKKAFLDRQNLNGEESLTTHKSGSQLEKKTNSAVRLSASKMCDGVCSE